MRALDEILKSDDKVELVSVIEVRVSEEVAKERIWVELRKLVKRRNGVMIVKRCITTE